MEDGTETKAYGLTSNLGLHMKKIINFKLEAIHLRSRKIQFGFLRKRDALQNKPGLLFGSVIDERALQVFITDGDDTKDVAECTLPDVPVKFAIELNTQTRTVHFLLNSNLLREDDIPIPWPADVLREMSFYVRLFEPGDCVRIID